MNEPDRVQSLAVAVGTTLGAAIAERPGVTTLEVCGVLGAAAGVVVAGALPHASAEVDDAHLDAMATAYRSALLEVLVAARDARVTVKN